MILNEASDEDRAVALPRVEGASQLLQEMLWQLRLWALPLDGSNLSLRLTHKSIWGNPFVPPGLDFLPCKMG